MPACTVEPVPKRVCRFHPLACSPPHPCDQRRVMPPSGIARAWPQDHTQLRCSMLASAALRPDLRRRPSRHCRDRRSQALTRRSVTRCLRCFAVPSWVLRARPISLPGRGFEASVCSTDNVAADLAGDWLRVYSLSGFLCCSRDLYYCDFNSRTAAPPPGDGSHDYGRTRVVIARRARAQTGRVESVERTELRLGTLP
jgi:hypothetical protein